MKNSSTTMLVTEEKLIGLLLNENKNVRDEAVSALERYFPKSRNVIKHILKAFNIYKDDTLGLLCRIKSFLPDEADIPAILRLLAEVTNKKDENSMSIFYHLMSGLYQFPYDLIAKHQESFGFNEYLKKNYEIITKRNQVKSQTPQILWEELSDICKRNKGNNLDDNTGQYAGLLAEGLLQYGDEIRHKVIMSLSQATTGYHFELYMVQIVGELKICESVPYLFRILMDSDFMDLVYNECAKALGKIGGREVVNQVELLYPKHESVRDQLASILKWIPYDYSEDLAIRLLKDEQDVVQKTFLAEALCGMFSLKAVDLIIDIIENRQYDPSIVNLSDLLAPIYEYYHQPYDLSSLQKSGCQFFQEKMENDPLHQELTKVTNTIMKLEDHKSSKRKVGRNDPCPCGSGKKYKKCCLNNDRNLPPTNRNIPNSDVKRFERFYNEQNAWFDRELSERSSAEVAYDEVILNCLREGQPFAEAIKTANVKYPDEALQVDVNNLKEVREHYEYLLNHLIQKDKFEMIDGKLR
jgi:hypothetical protein